MSTTVWSIFAFAIGIAATVSCVRLCIYEKCIMPEEEDNRPIKPYLIVDAPPPKYEEFV